MVVGLWGEGRGGGERGKGRGGLIYNINCQRESERRRERERERKGNYLFFHGNIIRELRFSVLYSSKIEFVRWLFAE